MRPYYNIKRSPRLCSISVQMPGVLASVFRSYLKLEAVLLLLLDIFFFHIKGIVGLMRLKLCFLAQN